MAFSSPINHEYFFPNILAVREYVENLVAFCDGARRTLQKNIDEDERKNESVELSQRKYDYKKLYDGATNLRIFVYDNSGSSSNYDGESAFRAAASSGRLNDIAHLDIDLTLSFGRGIGNEIDAHKNVFSISFKPYDIKLVRDSNFSDPEMDALEEQLIKMMEDFPTAKTIFTAK